MPTKVHIVKAMVFPVAMYRCSGWIIKKPEPQRIVAFELWYWRRLLGVSWTARKPKQSILKEINSEYSLEVLALKLKLQYFGHLMQRADTLQKTLMLGKIESKRRKGLQRMRWLNSFTDSMDMSWSKLQEIVNDVEAWLAIVHGVSKSWTQLSDWTHAFHFMNHRMFILFLMGIWVISSLEILQPKLLWTLFKSSCDHMSPFLLGQYLLVELLDQSLVYVKLHKNCQIVFQSSSPVYILSNCAWVLDLHFMLTSIINLLNLSHPVCVPHFKSFSSNSSVKAQQ